MLTTTSCGVCAIEFCLPTEHLATLRKNGRDFYCPNGHCISFRPSEKDKRIAELEAEVRRWKGHYEEEQRDWQEVYASREDLIGVLKECPFECGFRSRRRVPRDPVEMGRGIERVLADLREHLLIEHAAHAATQRLLAEAT